MKNIIMKAASLLLTAVITAQTSAIYYAGAEDTININSGSCKEDIMYYDTEIGIDDEAKILEIYSKKASGMQ